MFLAMVDVLDSSMRCFNLQHTKKDEEGNFKVYPCGNCVACKHNDSVSWGLRSYFEAQSHEASTFCTLTYDDQHLLPSHHPAYSGNLSIAHHQDFIKRLSYYCGKVRFLVGAEYGDTTKRPHYHYLLFGVSIDNPVFFDKFYVSSKKAWICRCKAWNKGEVCIRPLDIGSCFYTAKYSLKYDKNTLKELELAGMQKPFRLMSRRPGLGYDWFLQKKDQILVDGYVRFKGSKLPIPRYWYDKALPPGTIEREDYTSLRSTKLFSKFASEERRLYGHLVGKGKQYLTWTDFYNAMSEQQFINVKGKK